MQRRTIRQKLSYPKAPILHLVQIQRGCAHLNCTPYPDAGASTPIDSQARARAAPKIIHVLIVGMHGDGWDILWDHAEFSPLFEAGRVYMLAKFLDDKEEFAEHSPRKFVEPNIQAFSQEMGLNAVLMPGIRNR